MSEPISAELTIPASGKSKTPKVRKKKKRNINLAAVAFLINFAAAFFGIVWTLIGHGGLFSVAGDFNVQQIPFAMYANDAIKSGNVVWDWSLDLGSNFVGGMTFYILGNPSFWISLLFPSDMFMYIVGWLYMLKYAFAGFASYLWFKRYVKNPEHAVIASMMYAFCGFMNEDLLFYHFHDVVALFPLLLITFDDLVQKNKKGPFIFAVLLNAIVNYFFFVGDVIFLAAYFVLRYVVGNGRKGWKKLGRIFTEGALGVLCGCALLLPAAIFTMQNPRVKFDYNGSNALVFSAERYLFILKGLLFPGEVMSDQSAVINRNFSSCSAYIPMTGLVLVIAFLSVRKYKKHWITRMLKWCFVMAVVPILNASFSLFAGLYHRWYYMPVLLFALCGAVVLDDIERENRVFEGPTETERAVSRGTLIWISVLAGFVIFLTCFKWSDSEPSKIYRMDLFIVWTCVSAAGTLLTWLLVTQIKKYGKRLFTAFLFLFCVGTLGGALFLYQMANGEDADGLHDRIETSANFNVNQTAYRFSNTDNPETLTHGFMASANFCSTVSGSIFKFYEDLGLERDVKSPEAPAGMYNLISAAYTYSTAPESDGVLVQTVKGKSRTYYIYQNQSVPPIGFTYDTYMTESDFQETPASTRAILMLKTLVIPDDKEDEVSRYLRKYDAATDGEATETNLTEISSAHLDECSTDIERTTDSYSSTIICDADKYAFFSIPDDSGWSATVNGKKAEIIDINGFMAVRVSAGTNRIEFHYTTPGMRAGLMLSAAGFGASAVYCVAWRRRRRKR